MRGIDVYHGDGYPLKTVPAKAYEESDFIIIKATQHESNYKYADYFKPVCEKAFADGKLVGAYHYASGDNPEKEAEYFLSVVNKYIGKIILALDWEAGQNKSWGNKTWAKRFTDYIEKKTGIKCFLYTNMDGISQCTNLANKVPLWFAGYPKNENSWSIPKWPSHYSTRPWMQYEIWQFTSGDGKVDRNITNMTPTDWMNYAKGNRVDIGDKNMSDVTAQDIIKIAEGWLGLKESDGSYKVILKTYNDYKPLARNYTVTTKDSWCATFISAVYIKAKAVDLIGGTECSVQRFIDIFKKKGIWNEDGRITPKEAWIIVYNWDDTTQPNDGWADHIGLVKEVKDGFIYVIEGNYNDSVKIRKIKVGDGRIRGYAIPKYAVKTTTVAKPVETTKYTPIDKQTLQYVADTMQGKYGSGSTRKHKLGASYNKVQEIINHISRTKSSELAKEVIAGVYGNGDIRKKVLGSKYAAVQKAVNKLTNG